MHRLCMTGTGTYQRAAVRTNFCLLCGLSSRESQSTEKEESQAEGTGSVPEHLHFSSSWVQLYLCPWVLRELFTFLE